jgi:WD40 repeat protein
MADTMRRSNRIYLGKTPSLRENNLQYHHASQQLFYTHKDRVCQVNVNANENPNLKLESYFKCSEQAFPNLNTVKLCLFNREADILVVADSTGLHFLNIAHFSTIYFYPKEDNANIYFTSIGSIQAGNTGAVFVGDNCGRLIVFGIDIGGDISLKKTISKSKHYGSISCIVASTDNSKKNSQVIVADSQGKIIFWEFQPISYELSEKRVLEPISFPEVPQVFDPVTCMCVSDKFLYASFGSGHVRIYNLHTGEKILEFQAHCRWIHAMDIFPSKNLVSSIIYL